ncbi:hypothetical protein GRP89_09545 [Citrobacter freundii]|uniref:hypothetical protein n=1 Tax=Citrobacter portucalensis TaxID=1639133 RepID=UPI00131F6E4A|nr:hypothetical protein [Citrobacter portucalensis]MBS6212276.1 hypothetical protein [Proteus hauseri]NKD27144.1 hypothetical protein [Citrobacter freundii]NLR55377.1 hypothetical protein [Citrobacter freundii]QHD90267.1 hypothetical protein GRP89_09545 [Citrobacter freundii]UMB87343.1 hypothetical protein I9P40_02525 [Citrobacter portucalensis]
MKKINFLNESDVYDELMEKFPAQPSPFLPTDIRGLDDPECVYVFFQNKQWIEIANNLELKNDSYALELGVLFLPEEVFRYYTPLYIYASLFNKSDFWVFESDFIQQYLCPEYRDHDDFLNFILNFSDAQLSIIAQFMSYESEIIGFSYASKACIDFWNDFL